MNSYILRVSPDPKRERLFEVKSQAWVDTMPLHINDLSGLKHSGKQIIASLRNKVIELQVQNSVLEAKLRQMEGCRLEGK